MDPELENRMFIVSIDESSEQTKRVVYRRAMEWAGDHKELNFLHIQEFMRLLKPFDKIIVPYSYVFADIIGDKTLKARRDIDKILLLCAMSAFLNQMQRPKTEKDGHKILFSTPEDAFNIFILSFESFEDTLLNLSKRAREAFKLIPKDGFITYTELAKNLHITKKMAEKYAEKLENQNYVEIERPGPGKTNKICRSDEIIAIDNEFTHYKNDILLCTLCKLHDYELNYEPPPTYYEPTTNQVRTFYDKNELKVRSCSRLCRSEFVVDFEGSTPVKMAKNTNYHPPNGLSIENDVSLPPVRGGGSLENDKKIILKNLDTLDIENSIMALMKTKPMPYAWNLDEILSELHLELNYREDVRNILVGLAMDRDSVIIPTSEDMNEFVYRGKQ